MGVEEEIKELEAKIEKTPSNKATQVELGRLKGRLAKLKESLVLERTVKRSGTSDKGYSVKKAGDATAVIIGFPSVGKSTLLTKITNAESAVAAYEFTTLTVVPGMMSYEKANIQILDVPGILEGAAAGRGRGKEVLAVARTSDLVMIMTDLHRLEHVEILKKELYDAGVRLNKTRPDVTIKQSERGGLNILLATKMTKMTEEHAKGILMNYGVINADVIVREDIDESELIDVIRDNRVYLPMFVILNKMDLMTPEVERKIKETIRDEYILISADKEINLEELKKWIFARLGLMRIYLKKPGKDPDMNDPLIMDKFSTAIEVCRKIHQKFARDFNYVKVWGDSAKFPGQKLGPDHVVADKDVLEFNFKK